MFRWLSQFVSLMFLGLATSYASAGSSAHHEGSIMSMLPLLIGFMLIFYFLLIRPQNKKAKEHKTLIENLKKGSEVITAGGILGKVTKLTKAFVHLELGKGVEVVVQRQSVSSVMPKGTVKSN